MEVQNLFYCRLSCNKMKSNCMSQFGKKNQLKEDVLVPFNFFSLTFFLLLSLHDFGRKKITRNKVLVFVIVVF